MGGRTVRSTKGEICWLSRTTLAGHISINANTKAVTAYLPVYGTRHRGVAQPVPFVWVATQGDKSMPFKSPWVADTVSQYMKSGSEM
jgi:hypothetical protein